MPDLFPHSSSRRDFVRKAAGSSGLLAMTSIVGWADESLKPSEEGQDPAANPGEFHVALLSDPHIPEDPSDGWNGFSPIDNLEKAVPRVIKAKPAAAIINGDAARLIGTVEDYKVLRRLLKPMAEAMPIFINLGNHDNRENFYKVFPESKVRPEHQDLRNRHVTVLESPVVRIIILDSLYHVNEGAGFLGKEQRSWLTQFLDESDPRPTVLVVHHTLGDGDGDLIDSDRLFAALKSRPQVKAIFYGHSHNYSVSQREEIQLINLPALGYNFSKEQPLGWADTFFHPTGVRFTLDVVAGNAEFHGKEEKLSWLR